MGVTIGIDPHKGSHTAVALDEHEVVLGQLRVRSGPDQLVRLTDWAEAWPAARGQWRTPRGSATSSLNSSWRRRKGTRRPAEACCSGSSARQRRHEQERPQRRPFCRCGCPTGKTLLGGDKEDHTAVMRLWARRRKDLTAPYPGRQPPPRRHLGARPRRLHRRDLCQQGGPPARGVRTRRRRRRGPQGARRGTIGRPPPPGQPAGRGQGAPGGTRDGLPDDHYEIFGVGPVVAAITVGLTADVGRFADKDHFAAYNGTAPIEVSSGGRRSTGSR